MHQIEDGTGSHAADREAEQGQPNAHGQGVFEPVTNRGSLMPLAAAARGPWYLPEHHQWVAARSPVAFWLGFSSKAHIMRVFGYLEAANTGNASS